MITIMIEGRDKSGKSHVVALVAKYLKALGCGVTVQSEETHNAGTLAMDEQALAERLKETPILIKEMRTSK